MIIFAQTNVVLLLQTKETIKREMANWANIQCH